MVYLQRWHGWRHMKLLPSRRKFVYTIQPCTMSLHAKPHTCLTVTCHLHFWQNERDPLRATAVTRGWNGYRNKSQHRKLTLEKKISRRSCWDSNPRPFNHESGALTTELSRKAEPQSSCKLLCSAKQLQRQFPNCTASTSNRTTHPLQIPHSFTT